MAIILFYGQAAVSCHNQSTACVFHPFIFFFFFGIEGKRPYFILFFQKKVLIRLDGDIFKYNFQDYICMYVCMYLTGNSNKPDQFY
jgi:hypothetical protein